MYGSSECLGRAALACAAVGFVLLALCQNTQAKPLEWNRLSKRIFCNYNGCHSRLFKQSPTRRTFETKRTIDTLQRDFARPLSSYEVNNDMESAKRADFTKNDINIINLKERIRNVNGVLENLKHMLRQQIMIGEIGLFEEFGKGVK